MKSIANMSKKACIIYTIIIILSFLIALFFVTSSLIILTTPNVEKHLLNISIIFLIVGCIMALFILLSIALTSLSSNYIAKNEKKTDDNIEESTSLEGN